MIGCCNVLYHRNMDIDKAGLAVKRLDSYRQLSSSTTYCHTSQMPGVFNLIIVAKTRLVTPLVWDVIINPTPIICIKQCPICIEYGGVSFNRQRGRLGSRQCGYWIHPRGYMVLLHHQLTFKRSTELATIHLTRVTERMMRYFIIVSFLAAFFSYSQGKKIHFSNRIDNPMKPPDRS